MCAPNVYFARRKSLKSCKKFALVTLNISEVIMKQLVKLCLGIAFAIPFSVAAQQYKIDWFTIDGGGGTSSGGPYTLSGTIGQPDAGRLAGGSFVLEGGFWGGAFAVQQVGAPTLFIQRTGGNVRISWNPDTPGFVLQESMSLSSPSWSNVGGGFNGVVLPASSQTKFYRLRRP